MPKELKGDQHKLDKNRNGRLDAHDFKLLRKMKTEESDLEEEIELEESFVVKDHQGKRAHVAYSEGEAKRKAEELTKKTGNKHSVVYTRSAVVAKEEYELDEAIKGWKHAHTDIAKSRAAASAASKNVQLHALTKAGKESGMHDARKSFGSVEDAEKHHADLHKLNPGKKFKHNLYVDGKLVKTLGESISWESAPVTYSDFMAKLNEAKKCMKENDLEKEDDEDEDEEEEKTSKSKSKVKFHDGEEDESKVSESYDLDEDLDEGLKPGQGSKPGWMLKADPELKKKLDAKIALAKARQKSYGDPSAGKSVKEGFTFQDLLNRLSR